MILLSYQISKAVFAPGVRRLHLIRLFVLYCILTATVLAQTNYALQFDGIDDFVECFDLGFGNNVIDITVEIWIKPNTITDDDGIWAFMGTPFEEFILAIWNSLYHTKTDGQWFNYPAHPEGEWKHVVITYDGITHSIYLDGNLYGSNSFTSSLDLTGRSFLIGNYDDMTYYADGIYDEVRVWDVARTEAEIQADMYHELTGTELGLVGYWSFNESTGDTTFDISGNGNDGIINGATWVVSDAPLITNSRSLWNVSAIGSDSTGDGSTDYPLATIQRAIDYSYDTDTVLVMPGTYVENINFLGKNITVGSLTLTTGDTSFISQTIVDGDQNGSNVVTFENGEDSTAVLNGFTIQNGVTTWYGGGILCGESTNPIIVNVTVKGNHTTFGGGVYCDTNSRPSLENVTITGNSASSGGGIFCHESSPRLENVIITDNLASVDGGGIYCDESSASLVNATVTSNMANRGGGIYSMNFSAITVINSIIWSNTGDQININDDTITISYSNISGGMSGIIINVGTVNWLDGNINAFPVFCDPDSGDYTLADNSPCVGTGEGGTNMGALGIGCGYISTDNMALRFNDIDNDYVAISYGGLPTGSNPLMTITAWIQCEEGENFRGIIGWGETGTDASAVALGIEEPGGLGGAGMRIFVSHWGGPYDWDTGIDLHPGWNHIAYVHDGIRDIVYLDGDSVASQIVSFTIGSNPTVNIGFWDDFAGTPYYFNGIIDEVRIWRIVRTPAEIQDYMYRGLTGSEVGLDGYWTFNEGAGNIAYDIGGLNNGIINGAEWILSDVPMFGPDSITMIIVPDDQPTIQAGIDFADPGDTVLVQPGTYVENINFLGKNITVGSLTLTTGDTSYIRQTIIDGDSIGRVVTFESGEDSTAVLNGFTITNGIEWYDVGGGIMCGDSTNPIMTNVIIKGNQANYGGGIYCGTNSSPIFMNVLVDENVAKTRSGQGKGGGIYCGLNSSTSFSNVTITDNTAELSGGGIYCGTNSSPIFMNVLVDENVAKTRSGQGKGGGIYCGLNSSTSFSNVTITDNTAELSGCGIYCDSAEVTLENVTITDNNDGGIYSENGSDITVLNSIIWYNSGYQISCGDSSTTITISYSNISGGEAGIIDGGSTVIWLNGNINALPLFCNPDSGVYTLAVNSPCVGTGEGGANMGALGIGCGYISTDNLALRFDGIEDFVLLPDSISNLIMDSQSLTFGGWFLLDDEIETTDRLMVTIGTNWDDWSLYIDYADEGKPSLTVSGFYHNRVVATTVLTDGNWHYVAGTYDGTTANIYVNGLLENSNTQSFDNLSDSGGFVSSNSEWGWQGIIDEVSIWNDALTEAEIQVNMHHEPTGTEPALVGYWAFNEGAGDTIYDYSLNSYDGVIYGAEWVLSDIPMFGGDSITLIIVPEDQPTIQAAIDFATHGDTVLVMPGTYVENINFNGKNIVVGSLTFTTGDTSYIKQTIIDGNQNGSVVTFENWEDSTAQLCGFTIINGSVNLFFNDRGAGIYCKEASPLLRDLIIKDNQGNTGGGAYFYKSNPKILNCQISDNTSTIRGGGITAYNSKLALINILMNGNSGEHISESTLHIYSSDLIIHSSTVINTDTLERSIIYCTDSSNIVITNSILWNLGQTEIQLSEDGAQNVLTITHSNIEGGLDSIDVGDNTVNWLSGNIDADPLFVDSANGIYQLMPCSPCIGAGSNDSIPAMDIDGNPRPDPPGSLADMGAYEHLLGYPRDIPEIQVSQSALDFDEAFITYHDTLINNVSNWGCDVLYIFAETDLVEYVVEPEFIALEQGERDSFLVIFTPIYCSNYPGNLTLTTNDQDESTIVVPLTGQGVLPPNISVYPYRYDLEMNLDLMETHTSVISNTGGSDLVFELTMEDLSRQGGYALQFDGIDDYVDCGDLGFDGSSDSITVAMWINPDTLAGDRGFWEFPGATEQFSFSIQDGYYHTLIAGQYFGYSANPAGEWSHLAVTYDGLVQSIYLDGELRGSNLVSDPASFDISDQPFMIGSGSNGTTYCDGAIDAVTVWNTVRNEAQISSDMHRTISYNEPGLVGYWRFTEGIGDTTSSYTIDNHTGTIYGAPEWIESTAPITKWITASPLSGTIESSGSQDITIIMDASNLLVGDYFTEIQLFSNDPDQGLITIPVSLITVVSVKQEPPLPVAYQLHQNYPNPFNPVTTIKYDLPQDSHVRLTIYNILGQQVIVLADDHQVAGYKSIRWNGRNTSGKLVSAGMYFYAVEAGKYSAIRKMVLLK